MPALTQQDPKWLRDVLHLLPIRSQFVLSGNIRDLVWLGNPPRPMSLKSALWQILEPLGYQGMLIWDQVDGLQAFPGDQQRLAILNEVSGENLSKPGQMLRMDSLVTLLKRVCVPEVRPGQISHRVALVIDYASRLRGEQQLPEDARALFVAAEKAALEARPISLSGNRDAPLFNPVFWLANRASDIPYWFTVDNERVRSIPIPLPDAEARSRFAHDLYEELPAENRDIEKEVFAKSLSGMTHNMSLNALWDIATLAGKMGIKASDIDDAVQSFRVGDMSVKSPWRGELLRERIINSEQSASEICIENAVKGQPKAVSRVLDILKRTSLGLTGAQSAGSASRPRGVLFFVGPTGVGKTEMAKTIAKVVFNDETAYKRFDMSEFSAEHSGDRLIGAPPGYVGFDQGGELTNHMRERPFSVLLFDEIEKAHDRILDKFLQILEDGRLTDGRGETVYFSDALIIFTSNLGITRELPNKEVEILVRFDEDISPHEFERRVMEGVRDHFVRKLRRPELLNRLGQNVVIFNFITEPVAREILDGMVSNVRNRVMQEHQVTLDITPIQAELTRLCTTDRSNGGRGIGSKLEEVFTNPLSRLMFMPKPREGSTLIIDSIDEANGIYTLHGHTPN
jgi:hypothetical protein